MSKEIERKFLVKNSQYRKSSTKTYIQQGYLTTQPDRVVRVRVKDDNAYITIKGATTGATRFEYEYPIPVGEAQEIITNLCKKPYIEKNRYIYTAPDGHIWEIDEFLSDNAGLVVAEIELATETETFDLPEWVGEEVTADTRYYNSNLQTNPYKNWK